MLHWGYLGGPGFMTGGWMLAFGIARVLVFALIIYGIVRFVRSKNKIGAYSSAIEVLNERYARGEIDETEYMERKTVLTK